MLNPEMDYIVLSKIYLTIASQISFQSKFFATICVLFVVIECCVEASEHPSVHLRQKRGSPDFFGKIKSVSMDSTEHRIVA